MKKIETKKPEQKNTDKKQVKLVIKTGVKAGKVSCW